MVEDNPVRPGHCCRAGEALPAWRVCHGEHRALLSSWRHSRACPGGTRCEAPSLDLWAQFARVAPSQLRKQAHRTSRPAAKLSCHLVTKPQSHGRLQNFSCLRGRVKFSLHLHQSKLGGSSLKLELPYTYTSLNQTMICFLGFLFWFQADFKVLLDHRSQQSYFNWNNIVQQSVQIHTCYCFASWSSEY